MKWLERKIPPAVLLALTAAGMWAVVRWSSFAEFSLPGRVWWCVLCCGVGIAIAMSGVWAFSRRGTTVNPLRPERASALVETGIYRFTRNPMYLGMLFGLLGWGVLLQNAICVFGLCLFVLLLNRLQIVPEERALGALFGKEFQRYCARVRRWI